MWLLTASHKEVWETASGQLRREMTYKNYNIEQHNASHQNIEKKTFQMELMPNSRHHVKCEQELSFWKRAENLNLHFRSVNWKHWTKEAVLIRECDIKIKKWLSKQKHNVEEKVKNKSTSKQWGFLPPWSLVKFVNAFSEDTVRMRAVWTPRACIGLTCLLYEMQCTRKK